jgi:uncharacterized protein (TIGR02145 family)
MKQIITICAAILMTASVFAQAPNKMSYQAVIRNSSNTLVTNTAIGMRISILQTSSSGTAVYVETHTPTTNANGLASIEIGDGTLVNGNFANINWANGPYFIKTETDPSGGNNYTITGTSQLLSVPYSFFSGNGIVRVSTSGDTLYLGNGSHLIIPGISAANPILQTGISTATCGAINVLNAASTYGSMTDQDGNVYKTVVIGTQEWMAENLKASHYRNGINIPLVNNSTVWQGLTGDALCWYNDDSATYNCPFGKLYNWYAVTSVNNLCPSGWHIPSDSEWNKLAINLDNTADTTCIACVQSSISGGKLKTTGTQYWSMPNNAADNSSGFSAIAGGYRNNFGLFSNQGSSSFYWSNSVYNTQFGLDYYLDYNNGNINKYYGDKRSGLSVRCLKD